LNSLKNHGADKEVSDMFEMGAETMALPLEERMKFEQGDGGQSFGSVLICLISVSHLICAVIRYKKAGANAVDAAGVACTPSQWR